MNGTQCNGFVNSSILSKTFGNSPLSQNAIEEMKEIRESNAVKWFYLSEFIFLTKRIGLNASSWWGNVMCWYDFR